MTVKPGENYCLVKKKPGFWRSYVVETYRVSTLPDEKDKLLTSYRFWTRSSANKWAREVIASLVGIDVISIQNATITDRIEPEDLR